MFAGPIAGCSRDSRWERSRTEYCQELDLLSRDVPGQIEVVAHSIQGMQQSPAETRLDNCASAERDLRVLSARIRGFTTVAHVLARARPDNQSVEEAGFELSLGAESLERYDSEHCRMGRYQQAAQHVLEIKSRVERDFEQGLARCRSVGWKSVLVDLPGETRAKAK